jgi:hypothetical protein
VIRHNGIEIDIAKREIRHRGARYHSAKYYGFALVFHLIMGQHSKSELFDLLYSHRADGGPELGDNHIAVMLSQKRPIFERLQLELKKERGAHYWTRYQLVPKENPRV